MAIVRLTLGQSGGTTDNHRQTFYTKPSTTKQQEHVLPFCAAAHSLACYSVCDRLRGQRAQACTALQSRVTDRAAEVMETLT